MSETGGDGSAAAPVGEEGGGAVAPPDHEDSGEQGLHPAAVVLLALQGLREAAVPILGVAAVAVLGGGFDLDAVLDGLSLAVLAAVVAAIRGLVGWRTTRYVVADGALRVRRGLLSRRETTVPLGRIQTVDLRRGPLQRALGVVAVEVQTAGGGEQAEIALAALTPGVARALEARLRASGAEPAAASADPPGPVRRLGRGGLLVAAVTAPQFGVVLPALAGLSQLAGEVLPKVVDLRAAPDAAGILRAVALLLTVAWLLSIMAAVVAFAGFELRREGDRLLIRRGLLQSREVTFPAQRLQAVVVVEGLLRQPFGLATVRVAVAGSAGEAAAAQTLFPLVRVSEVAALLDTFVPEAATAADALERPPARARRRYLVAPTAATAVIALALTVVVNPWLGTLVLLGPMHGLAAWRAAGLRITGDRLALRERRIARHTTYATRRGLQWRALHRTPLQARGDLVSLSVVTSKRARATVRHLDAIRAGELLRELGPPLVAPV